MRSLSAVVLTAVLVTLGLPWSMAASPGPTISELGGRFATCTAYIALMSEIADRQADALSARRLSRLAQGWRAAGYAVVRSNTEQGRTESDEDAFDRLVLEIYERETLRMESDPQRTTLLIDRALDQTCRPLAPLQGRLIDMMREAQPATADN
jgi:hypothetical protein